MANPIAEDQIDIKNIASVVGASKNSLSSIYDSLDNCNVWAKYKPIHYGLKVPTTDPNGEYTNEFLKDISQDLTNDMRKEVNWGVLPPGTFTDSEFQIRSSSYAWTDSELGWKIHKPDTRFPEVIRLRDFIGYVGEGSPSFKLSCSNQVYSGSMFRVGLNYTRSSNYAYIGGSYVNTILNLNDLTWFGGNVENYNVWLFFYVKNTNGKYYPKFAYKTGYTVSDCTSNNTVEIGGSSDDESNLGVGTTYTMIACAVPSESRFTEGKLYKCDNDQLGLAILPLTLNGGTSDEIISFSVQNNPTPDPTPEQEVQKMCKIGDNNYGDDNGAIDMSFNMTSYPTITWTNPRVSIEWSGESHRNKFQLFLMSGNETISKAWNAEFENLGRNLYITTNDMGGTPTFENCKSTNITGVMFKVFYDGDYREVKVVSASGEE